jgi:hypothetical protein
MSMHKRPKNNKPDSSKIRQDKPRVRVEAISTPVASSTPSPPAYQRQFDFSATARAPEVTPLQRRNAHSPRVPMVMYTPEVWDQLWFIVGSCPQEVGWLGLVDTLPSGDYLITEIFVPEQTVHATETEIKPDAMTALAMELIDAGKDTNKLIYWGHSHVNMGVSPSGQDERQVDEYLANGCKTFIRGIYNKKGERKLDVFDQTNNLIFQCVRDRIYSPGLSPEQRAHLTQLIKANVKSPTRAFGNTSMSDLATRYANGYYVPPRNGLVDQRDDDDDAKEYFAHLSDPFYAGKP